MNKLLLFSLFLAISCADVISAPQSDLSSENKRLSESLVNVSSKLDILISALEKRISDSQKQIEEMELAVKEDRKLIEEERKNPPKTVSFCGNRPATDFPGVIDQIKSDIPEMEKRLKDLKEVRALIRPKTVEQGAAANP